MTISAHKLQESALRHGIESFKIYREKDLDPFFVAIQRDLFKEQNKYGWYCWKPYVVLHAMLQLSEGDYLIYLDAGNEILSSVDNLVRAMDQDILFFSNGWQHSHWCKREVAEKINFQGGSDMSCIDYYDFEHRNRDKVQDYYSRKQVQASTFILKVTRSTIDFIKEWYAYSILPGMIDNIPRGEQFPEFQEHRHDQALITCLQIKHGYRLHWFPSTYAYHIKAEYSGDNYPAFLEHHRKRNSDYGR